MAPGALLTEGRLCQANDDGDFGPRTSPAAIQRCILSNLDETLKLVRGRSSVKVKLDHHQRLRAFCEDHGAPESDVLRVAWGLLLRCYTGNDTICFGYGSTTEHCGGSFEMNGHGTTRLDLRTDTILTTDTFMAILARFAGPATVWNERTNGECTELLQPPFGTVLLESISKGTVRSHVNDGTDIALSQVHFASFLVSSLKPSRCHYR